MKEFELLATNIKKFRIKRQMFQRELADECGVDRTSISDYERKKKRPRLEVIILMCKSLKIEIGDLFK